MYKYNYSITRSFSGEPTENPLDWRYYSTQGGDCPEKPTLSWKSCTKGSRFLHSLYPGRPYEPTFNSSRTNIPSDNTIRPSDVPPFIAFERCRTSFSTLHMNPHVGQPGYEWMWRSTHTTHLEPPIDDALDQTLPRASELPQALAQWSIPASRRR